MERLIFGVVVFVIYFIVQSKAQQKKAAKKMKNILEIRAEQQSSGRTTPSPAFEQARQRAVRNQRTVNRTPDPGRVSAASVARGQKKAAERRREKAQAAIHTAGPFMRPVVTQREKFERSSAYETSNRMDVRYTSQGCGCSTGKGNAASGAAHGATSAIYDEARFFKESREICSGKWS